MKILTSEQMKKIDNKAINEYKIPEIVLMENAGIKSVLAMLELFKDLNQKKVLVICGPGNNGGDGLVIARHLFNLGCQVNVVITTSQSKYKGTALENLNILTNMGINIYEINSEASIYEVLNMANFSDIIVDAIFGTGLSKKVDSIYLALIEGLNSVSVPKFSIDIPSGIDASTGLIMGAAIKAYATVTFESLKVGHILDPGSQYTGKLFVADISIPKILLESEEFKYNLTTKEYVANKLVKRNPNSNKGDYGRALIIGGSKLYAGAPKISLSALLRSGAGISLAMVPDCILNNIQSSFNDAIVIGLSSTPEGTIDSNKENIDLVLKFIEENKINSIAIGMGLTQNSKTLEFVSEILSNVNAKVCIDADGLYAFKKYYDKILKNKNLKLVLTPHPKEFARLIDVNVDDVLMNRINLCEEFTKKYKLTLVLKGHRTIICNENGDIYINTTGNAAMAKGGMGDALSGIIAGFLASTNMSIFDAAICACYIHGKAGDIATNNLFEYSLTTCDLIAKLSDAMKITVNNE